jgi:hypothetical protein
VEPDHNTEPASYPLNLTANFYQLSPQRFLPYQADINRVVTVKVTAFEEGYNGECVVYLRPDPGGRRRSRSAWGRPSRSTTSRWTVTAAPSDPPSDSTCSRSTTTRCSATISTTEKLVDTVRITNDLATDPSMIDSLQMRMITPGNGTGLN